MTDIVVYETSKHAALVQDFVNIHMACTIENPMTVANFVLPFTPEKQQAMQRWWTNKLAQAEPGGTDDIVMAFNANEQGVKVLSGYVILNKPVSESGPFRGEVQKLFVSPDFRRQGIARKMMAKLEEIAKAQGRTMLKLATATPSPARSMYPKLGYIEYGSVPDFVVNAETKELMSETLFYKDLR